MVLHNSRNKTIGLQFEPENLDVNKPSKQSSWWRRLEDVFRLSLQKTSSRRLDQDKYVRLSLTSSKDVFKTSWSRLIYSSWSYVFKTSSRHFQDVFKTPCKDILKTFWRLLQDVFQRRLKTSSRHFQDVFKTSSRNLQDVFKTSCKDIFNSFSRRQVKLFLLTRLREVFNTFLRCSFPKTVIYRGICLGNTTSEKFMVSVQNLQEI